MSLINYKVRTFVKNKQHYAFQEGHRSSEISQNI